MRTYKADSTGNCLQCCLASILDIDLESVPWPEELSESAGGWYVGLYDWLFSVHQLRMVAVTDDVLDGLYHIEVIESRCGVTHARVCKGTDVIMDPRTAEAPSKETSQYRLLLVPTQRRGCGL